MTAFEFRRITLHCNGRHCGQYFQGEEGIRPTSGETLAAVRKRAAEAGWTHVRGSYSRRSDWDYCPEHKPEGGGDAQARPVG